MKKIIIVNNNMQIGGVQKSLCNLLWEIVDQYDITLYLFNPVGEYFDQLPSNIEVKAAASLFRYLGVSQGECRRLFDRMVRGGLAFLCKRFGRSFVLHIMLLSQKKLPEEYDVAISYLQNGRQQSFYGGANEFVLKKVNAKKKISFLHCDYANCGANNTRNNILYNEFDKIAACSDGCRNAFLEVLPALESRCFTVKNCHRYQIIKELSADNPVTYKSVNFNVIVVGRLAHEKAVDRAIKAVAYGRTKQLPLSLHIIGDGNQMESLKELVTSLGIQDDVVFYGEQLNPYRFMTNADLLMITSYHEAAPMIIEEARIVGLPVLTVKTTSSDEMVRDNQCGWVCENSQEGLNRMLCMLASDTAVVAEITQRMRAATFDNQNAVKSFCNLVKE